MSEMCVSVAMTSSSPLSGTSSLHAGCSILPSIPTGMFALPSATIGPTHDGRIRAMAYRVTFIPGDGVGPELSEATRRVLEATGVAFDWDRQDAGAGVMDRFGTPLPDHVLDSIRSNGVAIKGPVTTPVG